MDLWEDIRFKQYPRKLLILIVAVMIAISAIVGVVKQDAKKGFEIYYKGMSYVFKPVFNYAQYRGEKWGGYFEKIIHNLFENT